MEIDFIYTDSNLNDLNYLKNTTIDLEIGKYGVASNDFEITLSSRDYDTSLKEKSIIYSEDSEWGGMIESIKSDTATSNITFKGITFRGMLEKEYVQPLNNQAYYFANGEANKVLNDLISNRFNDLFIIDNIGLSDINVNYQIRDLNLLQAIEKMFFKANISSRLDIKFYEGKVHLQAIPIVDLSDLLLYDNSYGLSMIAETPAKQYNHILCLGKGELTQRLRVNLFLNKKNEWTTNESESYYIGLDRKTYVYENTNTDDSATIIKDAIEKVKDINGTSSLSISFKSDNAELFDVVGSKEEITGIEFKESITSKILKGTLNGALTNINISYKVGD